MALNRGNPRSAKVTPDQVLNIRRRYTQGETQSILARDYGLSVGQIGRIVRNEAHQNLDPVPETGRYRNQSANVTEADVEASLAKLQGKLESDIADERKVEKDLEEFLSDKKL